MSYQCEPGTLNGIRMCWCESQGTVGQNSVYRDPVLVGPAVQSRDAATGSNHPEDNLFIQPQGPIRWRSARSIHGAADNDDTGITQTPLPVSTRGSSPLGPTGAHAALMGQGGDVPVSPYRTPRYNAIRRIPPESSASPGSVARQSYQYVAPLVPMPRPYNFQDPVSDGLNPILANGGWTGRRDIKSTIPPALEPPRHNYTSLDTDFMQQQSDIIRIKAELARRGANIR